MLNPPTYFIVDAENEVSPLFWNSDKEKWVSNYIDGSVYSTLKLAEIKNSFPQAIICAQLGPMGYLSGNWWIVK